MKVERERVIYGLRQGRPYPEGGDDFHAWRNTVEEIAKALYPHDADGRYEFMREAGFYD